MLAHTTALMWVGTIALIGFWPLSKDAILASALHGGRHRRLDRTWRAGRRRLHRHLRHPADAARVLRRDESTTPSEHLHTRPRRGALDDVLAGGGAGGRCACCRVPVDRASASRTCSTSFLGRPRPRSRPTVPQDVLTTAIGLGAGRRRRAATSGGCTTIRPGWPPVRSRFQTMADHRRGQVRLGRALPTTSATGRRCGWRRHALTASVERWIIGGSLWLARTTVATLARRTALAQSGVVRQYATVLAGGAALRGRVYFLGQGEPVTVALIALPLICAVLVGFLPLTARVAARAGAGSRCSPSWCWRRSPIVTFNVGGGSQFVADQVLDPEPDRRLPTCTSTWRWTGCRCSWSR